MATAKAQILVDAKIAAEQQFQVFFDKVNAQMGQNATAVQKLNATYELYSKWLKQQATDTANLVQPNAQLVDQYNRMGNAAKRAGETVDVMNAHTKKAAISFVDIAAKLYLVQVGFRNILRVAEELFKLGELGAKVQQAGESFEFLTQKMGLSAGYMEEIRRASGGLVTDFDAQLRVQRLLAGQTEEVAQKMAEAAPQLIEMARAAVKLDPSIKSVEFALESLSTGIKRQSVRWIDNLNITPRVGQAYKTLADELGISVEALTDEQKQLAYLNAVLGYHDTLLSQVGDNLDSATDKYGRLKVSIEETRIGLAGFMNEALSPTVVLLNEQLGVVNTNRDAWSDLGQAVGPAVAAWTEAALLLGGFTIIVKTFNDVVDMFTVSTHRLGVSSEGYSSAVGKAKYDTIDLVHAQQGAIDSTRELSEAQQELLEKSDLFTDSQAQQIEGLLLQGASAEELAGIFWDVAVASEESAAKMEGLSNIEKQLYEEAIKLGRTDLAEEIRQIGLAHIDAAEAAKIQKEAEKALADSFADFKKGFDSLLPSISKGDKSFADMREEVRKAERALAALGDEGMIWVDAVTKIQDGNKLVIATEEDLNDQRREAMELTHKLAVEFDDLAKMQADNAGLTGAALDVANNKVAIQHDRIAELQDQIEDLTGVVITQEAGWQSNAGAIERAKERLAELQEELGGYTKEISTNVGALFEYEMKFKNAFNEENVGILQDFYVNMGLIDATTVSAKAAMDLILDPMNELTSEEKTRALGLIPSAITDMKDPLTEVSGFIDEVNRKNEHLDDLMGTLLPEDAALLERTIKEKSPDAVTAVGTIETAYENVDIQVKTIVEESVPGISKAVSVMVEESIPLIEKFETSWHDATIMLTHTLHEILKIGLAIDMLPVEKTITVNVVQTGRPPSVAGPGGQYGLDMTVPPGYSNDTFPLWATSGERVTITPANQIGAEGGTDEGTKQVLDSISSTLRRMPGMIGRSIRDNLRQ